MDYQKGEVILVLITTIYIFSRSDLLIKIAIK